MNPFQLLIDLISELLIFAALEVNLCGRDLVEKCKNVKSVIGPCVMGLTHCAIMSAALHIVSAALCIVSATLCIVSFAPCIMSTAPFYRVKK